MAHDITSKNIDGITDLVVVAPIKDKFIHAYENVTYPTRLRIVAEALNRVRVTAREHETITPFSDVTERILTLLDFRVGIIDKDLFALGPASTDDRKIKLESRRYLYLTATFDGAWEPYMRLIWNPLGPFLDLLFCNCEGYVRATEHSFEEYAQWVRDNQMDSAIFYATTGLTVRDHLYLSHLERLQRSGASAATLAELSLPNPEKAAEATRAQHLLKTVELGLEALTVLYKLADYYPPQWLTDAHHCQSALAEGHLLAQVARDLLLGWDDITAALNRLPKDNPIRVTWERARLIYAEPLHWYDTGRTYLAQRQAQKQASRPSDEPLAKSEVQGGILKPQGSKDDLVQHGALMLFTIQQSAAAREFLAGLPVHFEEGTGSEPASGFFRGIGFTGNGLLRLGLSPDVVDRFPKEFREGMAARSGLLGDMRENHPRNWILPERNGPHLLGDVPEGTRLPPVELSEVDFVVQVRTTHEDLSVLEAEVKRVAADARPGASLEAVQWLQAGYDPDTGLFRDHFDFLDGISQPEPRIMEDLPSTGRDSVPLGEVLLGYRNDRGDSAPGDFVTIKDWRFPYRQEALDLQRNGSFLVLRKIGQDADTFNAWIEKASNAVNDAHPDLASPMTPSHLKALVLGREPNGRPLVPLGSGGPNDFDFHDDRRAHACPFAAHIRRANPRPRPDEREHGRPPPRLLRRGMRFDETARSGPRGLMFMAYNASIAEQYEVIQRWLNGGNSTNVASGHNDALTGVRSKPSYSIQGTGQEPSLAASDHFRFIQAGRDGAPVAITVELPPAVPAPGATGTSEPGRHPFAPLHWGLYLFVPSRSALDGLTKLTEGYRVLRDPLENEVGQRLIERIESLEPEEAGKEWKRLIEDFDAKDPAQRDLSPNMWAAIRWHHGGVLNLRSADGDAGPIPPPVFLRSKDVGVAPDWNTAPDRDEQNVILCAGRSQVRRVLADWELFTAEEQLRRIATNSGPIFVTQQPDDHYRNGDLARIGLNYATESQATNEILLGYPEEPAFATGYAVGAAVLNAAKGAATAARRSSFKLELRRQFLLPALGGLCRAWYGLPDDKHMLSKGWAWERIVSGNIEMDTDSNPVTRNKAHCPGDFLSPSRNAFYPRPGPEVEVFAENHGAEILKAAEAFVAEHRAAGGPPQGSVARAMFAAIPDDQDAVLARNLIGTMVGAIPPMDGNLRGILLEWLGENTLWRHQAALHRPLRGRPASADFASTRAVLYGPVCQAMCKRPAPDLLYRTATSEGEIRRRGNSVQVQERDLVVVSLVSAAHRSLLKGDNDGAGDVSIVFGGGTTVSGAKLRR